MQRFEKLLCERTEGPLMLVQRMLLAPVQTGIPWRKGIYQGNAANIGKGDVPTSIVAKGNANVFGNHLLPRQIGIMVVSGEGEVVQGEKLLQSCI